MKWLFNFGEGVISLPERFADYIDKADPLALRLYLHLAAFADKRERGDVSALAREFAVTKEKVEEALHFWQCAGLLTPLKEAPADSKIPASFSASAENGENGEETSPTPRVNVSVKTSDNGGKVTVVSGAGLPNYTGQEIEAIMQGNPALSLLLDECQRVAGKLFGAREISQLLGLSDYLRLDHDYILLLFEYCRGIDKCSVPYVVKTAYSLWDKDIKTYSALEAFVASAEKNHSMEKEIRRIGGLGSRAFTTAEKKFVAHWVEMEISPELLVMAYEITANNTGKMAFPYMNKILSSWKEAGYTTASDVKAATERYRTQKETAKDASFDVDEFFEAAIKRSYGSK